MQTTKRTLYFIAKKIRDLKERRLMIYDELYGFQKEIINKYKTEKRLGLFMDMGLGKTITSLAYAEVNEHDYIIIVCPKKQINYWSENVKKYLPRLKVEIDKGTLISVLEDPDKRDFNVLIMSYGKLNEKTLTTYLNTTNFLWIFDEAQYLQSPTSSRGKNAYQLSKNITDVLLLSGDPISKSYINLFNLMRILRTGSVNNLLHFMREYMICGENYFSKVMPKILGAKHDTHEKLIKLIGNKAVWLKTSEAYDLPEQTYIDVEVEQTKEYRIYALTGLLEDTIAVNSLAQMIGLMQLNIGFLKDKNYTDPKIERLEEIILSTNKNLVIFYNFNKELYNLINLGKKTNRQVYQLNGETDQKADFIKQKDNAILLAQYIAGSEGVDGLQTNTDTIIYYSPTLRGSLYKQSLKRIHRIGQNNHCFYYRFKVKDTIDEKIYYALEKSQDYTLKLFEEGKKQNDK